MSSKQRKIITRLSSRFEALAQRVQRASQQKYEKTIPTLPRTASQRGKANLEAISILSTKTGATITKKEREALKKYTGWGGFSSVGKWNKQIKDPQFIATKNAITNEYYTPYTLTYSIHQQIHPIIHSKIKDLLPVPKYKGEFLMLEPSAGIGRFIDPMYAEGYNWNAVEPSPQSAKILMALYPKVNTSVMKFEEWAQVQNPTAIYSAIIANPPYKARTTETKLLDPDWVDYIRAETYQFLRILPMLNKGGICVMVIPRKTMSSKDKAVAEIREDILKQAHIIDAYRLPNKTIVNGKLKEGVFNVATPIDVIFLQARGGTLKRVPKSDEYIINGKFFDQHPEKVLGTLVKSNESIKLSSTDTKKNTSIYDWIVLKGEFKGLPPLTYRPIYQAKASDFASTRKDGKTTAKKTKSAESFLYTEKKIDPKILEKMNPASQEAYHIVPQIKKFISDLNLGTSTARLKAQAMREGLIESLSTYAQKYGNPHTLKDLKQLKEKDLEGYQLFISVYTDKGNVVTQVRNKIEMQFDYEGDPNNIPMIFTAWYDHLQKYEQFPQINKSSAEQVLQKVGSTLKTGFDNIALTLVNNGWCITPSDTKTIAFCVPESRYYQGDLWKQYDSLHKILNSDKKIPAKIRAVYEDQFKRLTQPGDDKKSLMNLATFGELVEESRITPTSTFVPDSLISSFFHSNYLGVYGTPKRLFEIEAIGKYSHIFKHGDSYKLKIKVLDLLVAFSKGFGSMKKSGVSWKKLIKDPIIWNSGVHQSTLEYRTPRYSELTERSYFLKYPKVLDYILKDKKAWRSSQDLIMEAYPILGQYLKPMFEYLNKEKEPDKYGNAPNNRENPQAVKQHFSQEKYKKFSDQWVVVPDSEIAGHAGFPSLLDPMQAVFYGMLVGNSNIFKPSFRKDDPNNTKDYKGESAYAAKIRLRHQIESDFLSFVSEGKNRKYWDTLTNGYNRQFRGYIQPDYAVGAKLVINGWTGFKLRPYQVEAVRKMADMREGLLAFDVGLGKTATGIATIALAKQQGWCQRPVILVPNSILFKWKDDIAKVIPSWKVVTIGANQYRDTDGNLKSKRDTPEQRGVKWLQFSLGAYDVALCTYSMFDKTKFRRESYDKFAAKHIGDEADIYEKIRQAEKAGKSTQKLIAQKEVLDSKISSMLLPPKNRRIFDKGVTWESIGVDLLMVDEAQNYKNLFMPKTDFTAPPKFLGVGKPSKGSFNLDIRCQLVRELAQRKYNGNNIFLLSATPAKNSPMEFYNLIQYMDPNIFRRYGIRTSGDFFQKFLEIENDVFYTSTMNVQEYPQVKQFKNLDEFREILNRYANFQVLETITEKYPEIADKMQVPIPEPKRVEIEASEKQMELISDILERMQLDPDDKEFINSLAGIMYMQMICISPLIYHQRDLFYVVDETEENKVEEDDKGKKPKATKKKSLTEIIKLIDKLPLRDLKSPKFNSLVEIIVGIRGNAKYKEGDTTCGNIVFIQNIAVQYMIKRLLIHAGVPEYSIGVMNAQVLKDPQSRQNVSKEFNFPSTFHLDKANKIVASTARGAKEINGYRYDILIANSVAYEGIDLQHRTCAIHHLDLAWEPATITQRNGRGVRSGNQYGSVGIYYYLISGSVDQYMFLTIQGKRNWLVSAVTSQDRVVNNVGATETSADTLALLASVDDADYERRLAIARKKQEELRARKARERLAGQMMKTGLLFYQAQREKDADMMIRAQNAFDYLQKQDSKLFPPLMYSSLLMYNRGFMYNKPYMKDFLLLPGMFYTIGSQVYVFLKKSGSFLVSMHVQDDWLRVIDDASMKELQYYKPNEDLRPEDEYLLSGIAYAFPHNARRRGQQILMDWETQFEFGSNFKSEWKAHLDEPERDSERIKRKQNFYNYLIKNGYARILSPNSKEVERATNKIFKEASFYRFERLPTHMKVEAWRQNIVQRMGSGTKELQSLLIYEEISNKIVLVNGELPQWVQPIETIKDGYTFTTYKLISPKITYTTKNKSIVQMLKELPFFNKVKLIILGAYDAWNDNMAVIAARLRRSEKRMKELDSNPDNLGVTIGDIFKTINENPDLWRALGLTGTPTMRTSDPINNFFYEVMRDQYRYSELLPLVGIQVKWIGKIDPQNPYRVEFVDPIKTYTQEGTKIRLVPFSPNLDGFKKAKDLIEKGRIFGQLNRNNLVNIALMHKDMEKIFSVKIEMNRYGNQELNLINGKNSKYFGLPDLGLKYNFVAHLHEQLKKRKN